MKFWHEHGGFLWLTPAVLRIYGNFEELLEARGFHIEGLRTHRIGVSAEAIRRLQIRLVSMSIVENAFPVRGDLRFPKSYLEDIERGIVPKGFPLCLDGLRC